MFFARKIDSSNDLAICWQIGCPAGDIVKKISHLICQILFILLNALLRYCFYSHVYLVMTRADTASMTWSVKNSILFKDIMKYNLTLSMILWLLVCWSLVVIHLKIGWWAGDIVWKNITVTWPDLLKILFNNAVP